MDSVFQHAEQPIGAPAWVLPYGDMMTLLLACFVMLASMSEIKEEKKFQATADSLRGRFGDELSPGGAAAGSGGPQKSAIGPLVSAGRARRADSVSGGDTVRVPLGEDVSLAPTEVVAGAALGVVSFDSGSATLQEQGRRILAIAAQKIGGKPRQIEIRGRACLRPVSTNAKRSAWELASARCAAAAQYLEKLGTSPRRVQVTMVAENQPRRAGGGRLLPSDGSLVEVLIRPEQFEELGEISAGEKQPWLVVQRPQ